MTDQMSIFDLPAGAQKRDAALHRVATSADPVWVRAAAWAIAHAAATSPSITTDHVWQILHDMAIPMPNEPRALGAAMKAAGSLGIITATDQITTSHRPECHCRPVRVWCSNVY
jgi:hypothetical protein